MKVYDARNSKGRILKFRIRKRDIWYTTGNKSFTDVMHEMESKYCAYFYPSSEHIDLNTIFTPFPINISYQYSSYYKRYDIENVNDASYSFAKYKNIWYIKRSHFNTLNNIPTPNVNSPIWKAIDSSRHGKLIITDYGNDDISSPYGYTYEDLHNMLNHNDYYKYIKDNDYIQLIIDGYVYTMRFNINTYHDYSNSDQAYALIPLNYYGNTSSMGMTIVPNHIDLVSDEVCMQLPVLNDFFYTNRLTEYMNKYRGYDPKLIINPNSIDMNFYNFHNTIMWNIIKDRLSNKLKQWIIPKMAYVPNRKIIRNPNSPDYYVLDINDLPEDSGDMVNMGLIWQLREAEIYGQPISSQWSYDADTCIQYNSCKVFGPKKKLPKNIKISNNKPINMPYDSYITSSPQAQSINGVIITKTGFSSRLYHNESRYATLNFRFA